MENKKSNTKLVRKYWREVIKRAWKSATNEVGMKVLVLCLVIILLLAAVLSGLVALHIPIPFPLLKFQIDKSQAGLEDFCFSIILLVVVFIAMIWKTPAEIDEEKEQKIILLEKKFIDPPELIKLAEMRKSGISLRNRGIYISNEKEMNQWIQEFYIWDTLMVGIAKEYSPIKASVLETLGNLPRGGYPNAVNELHRLNLNVFDEK